MLVAAPITPTRRAFAELLAEARARTVLLVSSLREDQLVWQPAPELGSVLSELDRIVRFEQQLLLDESKHQPHLQHRSPGSQQQASSSYDEWFDQMTDVRQRVLQELEHADVNEQGSGERYRRVLEHEYRRGESILEILQSLGDPYRPVQARRLPRGRRLADPGAMARFPGGVVEIGADPQLSPWPEERPVHRVELAPFWLDVMPVTNGDFMTFMGQGGYSIREVWSDEGWQWVRESQIGMPQHWVWQDGEWRSRRMGRESPLDFTAPVCHVSWYEAEAFARFVGKRLPTEMEWEAAAAWDPETQSRRHYPWGNMPPSPHVANLDQLAYGPAPVGALPGNLSPTGCYGLIGDVWEWTASAFLSYPGFEEQPSSGMQPRFGRHARVLRGGSWATRSGAVRATSRRSEQPEARYLFSGFRCARDA
jgi:gamma-glutamyl hercynylcysteine S-oxide synthase